MRGRPTVLLSSSETVDYQDEASFALVCVTFMVYLA